LLGQNACEAAMLVTFLGARPQTPRVGFAEGFGSSVIFCEAELRFLLLFLEKEEY
jgi:hypothetical protein